MARRSDHSREELYGLVLAEAQKIVESEGYKALTARRVAEAVGYSPGTLYNLFSNLDDLVVHLNARTLDLLDQSLAQVSLKGDPEADLLALAKAYLGFLDRHPRLWEQLFEYRLADDCELPVWYTDKIKGLLARVEAALAPLFRPQESQKRDVAVQVLWASLHGIGSLAIGGKLEVVTTRSVANLARSLVVNYVAGLKSTRGSS
ncbi:MAG: TetR/AcrR family transcriptional regulator [Rhodospirillales bacterium]|nr:MAG: TetR/AcrR family transcriptional regulator [Rhodospirillales bacterium]